MGCAPCKQAKKSHLEYIREIFDGLDVDGTQTLNEKEIVSIWDIAKEKKLQTLQHELDSYVKAKTAEIEHTKTLTAKTLLEDGKDVDMKQFRHIMNTLRLKDNELHSLWLDTKQKEIKSIQQMIKDAGNTKV